MDAPTALVVVVVVLLASVAQGLTGFGFALVVVPFLLLVVDVQDAVVMASLLGGVNVALLVPRVWPDVPWRSVGRMLAGSLVGMPVGLIALVLVPEDPLRVTVGLCAIAMAGMFASGLRLRSSSRSGELAAGAVSGVLRTSTGMSGPPVVLYLQGSGYSPERFRAALTVFFLLGSAISLGAFLGARVVTGHAMLLSAASLPAVVAGNWAGGRLLPRVNRTLFERLVLLLLIATSLSAVGSSLVRLAG